MTIRLEVRPQTGQEMSGLCVLYLIRRSLCRLFGGFHQRKLNCHVVHSDLCCFVSLLTCIRYDMPTYSYQGDRLDICYFYSLNFFVSRTSCSSLTNPSFGNPALNTKYQTNDARAFLRTYCFVSIFQPIGLEIIFVWGQFTVHTGAVTE